MKWKHRCGFGLALSLLLFSFSCGEGKLTEIVREVNACWSDDQSSIILVESSYQTSKPLEPFFNASSSRNWQVILHEAKVKGTSLEKIRELFRWTEEAQPGQTLQYHSVYWLRKKSRFIGMIGARPFLLNLDSKHSSFGKRILLRPSDKILLQFAQKDEIIGFGAHSPAPSPNGEFVGVFYTFSYRPIGGTPFDIEHTHLMSFFRGDDGKHIRTVLLPWSDKSINPHLTPPHPIIKVKYRFLWKADSSGIFTLHRKQAFFVPVLKGKIQQTQKVPSLAIQTIGGSVSLKGKHFVLVGSGNKSTIQVQTKSGWIPFQKVPFIAHGKEKYSVNVD